jgi:hypothetical protein
MSQNNRCAGCGKIIEIDAPTATVTMGRNTSDAAHPTKQWGEFHRNCFEKAIDSPSMAMAEIRRIAKKNTVVHGKVGGKSRNA